MRRKLLITIDALKTTCGECHQLAELSCWCRQYRVTLKVEGPGLRHLRIPKCLRDEERSKHGPTIRAR